MRADALSLKCVQYIKYIKTKLVNVKKSKYKDRPLFLHGNVPYWGKYYSFNLMPNDIFLESFGENILLVLVSEFIWMHTLSLVNILQAISLWSESSNCACLYWLLVVAETASWNTLLDNFWWIKIELHVVTFSVSIKAAHIDSFKMARE